MKNLELVTTENFGAVTCDFYRNVGNEIFMTREQIGEALEYVDNGGTYLSKYIIGEGL